MMADIESAVQDVWDGVLGEVSDASRRTRSQAIARYASETGYTRQEIRCTTDYVRIYDRQDAWEWWVEMDSGWDEQPDRPPDDWQPPEEAPCWGRCPKDHPDALRVYICEYRS
jgi:hypothetical protein